jgi:hypothetical protein
MILQSKNVPSSGSRLRSSARVSSHVCPHVGGSQRAGVFLPRVLVKKEVVRPNGRQGRYFEVRVVRRWCWASKDAGKSLTNSSRSSSSATSATPSPPSDRSDYIPIRSHCIFRRQFTRHCQSASVKALWLNHPDGLLPAVPPRLPHPKPSRFGRFPRSRRLFFVATNPLGSRCRRF